MVSTSSLVLPKEEAPQPLARPVRTLDLEEAADFLKMSPSSLRQKVKEKKIKAGKPGRRLVFLEDELINHIRSHYARDDNNECNIEWQSLNAEKPGGSTSRRRMDKEYATLLGLKVA